MSDEPKKEEPKKEDESVPKARLDAEVARRHKAEEENKALRAAQEAAAKKALEEQNNFKELYGKVEPRAKLADEMELSVKEYFDAEVADLTDEQKALIPEGAVHKQLAWIKKAKAAGVFGKQNSTDKVFTGKPKSGLPADKWYLELKSGDPRIGELTGPQYLEWKAHNAGGPVRVAGGF